MILLATALVTGSISSLLFSLLFPETAAVDIFAASLAVVLAEILVIESFAAYGCKHRMEGLLVPDPLRDFFLGSVAVLMTLWSLGMLLVFMLLLSIRVELNAYVSASETGILVLTLIAIVFLSRYTARSFSADVSILLSENRESAGGLRVAFAVSSRDLADSFERNNERMIKTLERQEQDRQAVLTDLSNATR